MSKANKFAKFGKNDKAFTGLEAAIVLIAFVVVAAVFSYVMLGAGFFTSQKAKQVVHTGVDMATSSVQLSGDVIGSGNSGSTALDSVTLTLQLTAGQSAIDLNKTIISFQDNNQYVYNAYDGNTSASGITWINQLSPANKLLESGEMAQITIPVNGTAFKPVQANDQITLTVIPPQGATLPITVTVPAAIHNSMALY
jgi:archaeal flagellin FlaB